jgi:hypothetical protein
MIHFEQFSPARERRLIGGILLTSGVLCLLLLALGFFPLRARKNALLKEMVRLDAELDPYQRKSEAPYLPIQMRREAGLNRQLEARWADLRQTVRTFRENTVSSQFLTSSEGGRIDFKVALFDARQKLAELSEAKQIKLPPDLGMDETIAADEDSETRLWQLAGTVKLLNTLIEIAVPEVLNITSQKPVVFELSHPDYAGLWEYPLTVELRCDYSTLLNVLGQLQRPETFFSIRRVRVRQTGGTVPEPLHVSLTVGADVLRSTEDVLRNKLRKPEEEELILIDPEENRG